MSIKDTCDKVKSLVDRYVTWKSDIDVYDRIEYWDDLSEKVLNHERSYGDCDDFTLTYAMLLMKEGIEKSSIRFVHCKNSAGDHLVCAVDDKESNTTWILDNNLRRVTNWNHAGLRYVQGYRLGDKTWKKITHP